MVRQAIRIGKTVIRGLAALLLAFAIVSPAVAEIGCSFEAAAHAGEAAEVAEPHADDAAPDDPTPERELHCAFSHGHCGGIAASAQDALYHVRLQAAFARAAPARFVSRSPIGPERPPRR